MGVTHKQMSELVNMVLKDIPRPPIQDMLSIHCKTAEETQLIVRFIKKHYTSDEVLEAFDQHLEKIKYFFGGK